MRKLAAGLMILGCLLSCSGCGAPEQRSERAGENREESGETGETVSMTMAEETVSETTIPETAPVEETRVNPGELSPIERYLTAVDDRDQMVLVIGDGTAYGGVLYYYEKSENGWMLILETEAQIGKGGFNDHTIEGDMTTPTGRYGLGIAFGNRENPGTALEWVDVNPYHYWIDDLESDYYNLLIDSRKVPDGWNSGEHLEEYVNSYAYAVNIEVNPERTKDSTSAIFLHCFGQNPYTLGCIAVEESQMVALLQRFRPGVEITVARDEDQLASMADALWEMGEE